MQTALSEGGQGIKKFPAPRAYLAAKMGVEGERLGSLKGSISSVCRYQFDSKLISRLENPPIVLII